MRNALKAIVEHLRSHTTWYMYYDLEYNVFGDGVIIVYDEELHGIWLGTICCRGDTLLCITPAQTPTHSATIPICLADPDMLQKLTKHLADQVGK